MFEEGVNVTQSQCGKQACMKLQIRKCDLLCLYYYSLQIRNMTCFVYSTTLCR
jgi:hypothetical protein